MKKIGRPRGSNNKDCVCTIRMDEHTMRNLETYCKLMKKAKSEVIRDAINLMVEGIEYTDSK